MSYESTSSLSFGCARQCPRAFIALACALVAGAAFAEPAAGQEYVHPGVYVEEVSLRSGQQVSGEARVVEPRDFGRTRRAPSRIVLEVGPGALQRAFQRAHEDGTTLALAGRMPERTKTTEPQYLQWELEDIRVTSFSTTGATGRVVLGPATGVNVQDLTFTKIVDKSDTH